MKNLTEKLVVIAVAKTIKGTSFIGVQGYTNQKGEVSNQTFVGGITYENALLNDFNVLKTSEDRIFSELEKSYSNDLILQAYKNVYESLEKRLSSDEIKEKLRLENDLTIKRSDAQIDAYTHVAKGIKIHKETKQVHLFGLVVRKTVLVPIEYKQVNSRELTIVQNKIKKLCEFKQDKYRNYIFEHGTIKIQGISI